MKNQIEKIILKAVKSFYEEKIDFSVENPDQASHGDYSTNVALVLSKKLNKNPREIAEMIKTKVEKDKLFSRVEIAGPGFVNFFISRQSIIDALQKISVRAGQSKHAKGWKVIVEYTDPNPFKEFHIGHLMNNAIGESLARIMESQGATVKKACYQGDVGLHVAKAIWALQKGIDLKQAYAEGYRAYEESETIKSEIVALNKKIFKRSDKTVNKIYDQGKKQSLVNFEKIYKKLGTKFDYYFLESQVAPFGKQAVEAGLKKGIFEMGEKGAVVFPGEKVGLHTRVFINSEGLPTYEAKELGLAAVKYKTYKYDGSIIITANEINEYFKVLLAAMQQVFPDLAKKTKHIGHGLLKLPSGKMSSRTGTVISAENLIDQVKEKIKDRAQGRNLSGEIVEQIAIGAIKYSILRQAIGSDIIYDFEKSVSFEGDSGPYLQYSYVRAISVLAKAKSEKIKPSFKKLPEEVGSFEKILTRFDEVVGQAGQYYQPHQVVLYLTELAREFNNWYGKHKIVDKEDVLSPYKVALTEKFATIMKNGLQLLGISVPSKM